MNIHSQLNLLGGRMTNHPDTQNHDQLLSKIDQMLRACDLFHWADDVDENNYWIEQPRFVKGQDLNIYQGPGFPWAKEAHRRPKAWVANIELKTSQTRAPSELAQHAVNYACELTKLGLPAYESKFMGVAAYTVGVGVQIVDPITWDQCEIQGACISFINPSKDKHQVIQYGEAKNVVELAGLLLNLIPDLRDGHYNQPLPYTFVDAVKKITFSTLTALEKEVLTKLLYSSIDESSGQSEAHSSDEWYYVLYPDYDGSHNRTQRMQHVHNSLRGIVGGGWLVKVIMSRGVFKLKIGEQLRGLS